MTLTPKEKAEELIEKYLQQLKTATPDLNRPHYQAKQCALLCVDETIRQFMWMNLLVLFDNPIKANMDSEIEFLRKVKQEIENL